MRNYMFVLCLLVSACVNSEFDVIRGKETDVVRLKKGEPEMIIHENGYEMWTYRSGECRQIVFFNEEGRAVEWDETEACQMPE